MKEFMSKVYSFDYNGNRGTNHRQMKKAPLISGPSEESQTDIEVVNPKRKKKPPLINEMSKLESDSEVVNPKRKTKILWINET